MNTPQVGASSFSRFVHWNTHSRVTTALYVVVMAVFIGVMCANGISDQVKAIVGGSVAGGHLIMALIYIPYRKEAQRQKQVESSAGERSVAKKSAAVVDMTRFEAANQEMEDLLGGGTLHWTTIALPKDANIKDLQLRGSQMPTATVKGEFANPSKPDEKLKFYAIKFVMKESAKEAGEEYGLYVITFSQRVLAGGVRDASVGPEWYCLGDNGRLGYIYICTGEKDVTATDKANFKTALGQLLAGTHPKYRLAGEL